MWGLGVINKDMRDKTRVFFVVDSTEDNEEIFETLEEALQHKKKLRVKDKPRIYIAIVQNAYWERDLKGWNYEDHSNTFEIICNIK